ncbi:MAG: gpW family protein [Proteobacteria bacterium]|nr:gpW family protein [Pseudomonadota bacterium]
MNYTLTDIDNVKNAIMDLVNGKKIVRVSVMGQVVEYGSTQLKELRELLSEMESTSSTKRRFVLTSTSKGL